MIGLVSSRGRSASMSVMVALVAQRTYGGVKPCRT
jgi:hypothetical protein